MEFFRWVLIVLGVAMLAGTYFLGRRKVGNIDYRRSIADEEFDPSIEDLSVPIAGRPSEAPGFPAEVTGYDEDQDDSVDGEEFLSDKEIDSVIPKRESGSDGREVGLDISSEFEHDFVSDPDKSARRSGMQSVKSFASAVKQASQRNRSGENSNQVENSADEGSDSNLSGDFNPYRDYAEQIEEKLVTVNVTAPRDHHFSGTDLQVAFENHGYEYGHMSIYHCSHERSKVFSIANILKPGSFDEDNMEQLETPGITLFMRLPVELDADVAFDFLIREATELADDLGGQLRDADRSTLSKQTIQHMREDIQQYVFRQKRALLASIGS